MSLRKTLNPANLLVVFVVGWMLALGWAIAGPAPARTDGGGHLSVAGVQSSSVTLQAAGFGSFSILQGRYRGSSARRWRVVRLGRRRQWTVHGLHPRAHYLFEVRVCAGPHHSRCGRWSRALLVRTAAAPQPPAPGSSGGVTDGPVTCPVFPPSNPINQDISGAPVDPRSDAYIASIGSGGHLHPDFGSPPQYGIPYTVVGPSQPRVPINFTAYGDESDPGPYPVPANAPVEGAGQAGDRHVLVVQSRTCKLYELYDAQRAAAGWDAGSGAVFDLTGGLPQRPEGWTSADAAGLPIFPLLARYDEVASGAIHHALRFTVARTQRGYIHPASHYASSSSDPSLPPMGLRLRLEAGFDLSGYSGPALVILQALKRYGMIVADNGSNWYISGTSDPRWDDSALDQLKRVPGSAFQVVQTGPIQH